MSNKVGPTSILGSKYTIGIGYLVLPGDISRDDYLKDCYLNLRVSILCEDGAFFNRMPISQEDLNFAVFPLTGKTLGSIVVYGTEELRQQPVVLKVLQQRDDIGDGRENQFKFTRKFNGALVEINGSASIKDRTLNLIVDGADAVGSINIHVFNQNQNCQYKVDIAGDTTLNASGQTSITQQKQISIKTTDNVSGDNSSIVQTPTENKLYSQKVTVNDGKNPITLGNELKDLLSNFIQLVSTSTASGSPLSNAGQIGELKSKLDTFLSKTGFLDK